jgi:hypothetical protein
MSNRAEQRIGQMSRELATALERVRRAYGAALGSKERGFFVYENPDGGSHHVLECNWDSGGIIADNIAWVETAKLIADLLDFAGCLHRGQFDDGEAGKIVRLRPKRHSDPPEVA